MKTYKMRLGPLRFAVGVTSEYGGRVLRGHASVWATRYRPRKYALRARLELGP